jgi:(p)ppGpp synthase/HD superfamily hydrolase
MSRADDVAFRDPHGPGADGKGLSSPMLLLAEAVAFAAQRHVGQRRKGARQEPYFNHLAEVAALVAEATEGRDAALVAAAYLHDVVEDTPATEAEIRGRFGADVAALVMEVTDDKRLPKAERKLAQIARAPTKSERAKLIKLADKISNLRSLADSPPTAWPASQRADYIEFSVRVVDGLRGASPILEAEFDRTVEKARRSLGLA